MLECPVGRFEEIGREVVRGVNVGFCQRIGFDARFVAICLRRAG